MRDRPISADNFGALVNGVLVLGILCLWATFGPAALAMVLATWGN